MTGSGDPVILLIYQWKRSLPEAGKIVPAADIQTKTDQRTCLIQRTLNMEDPAEHRQIFISFAATVKRNL
jgi:hypothetical protein